MVIEVYENNEEQKEKEAQEFRTEIREITNKAMMVFRDLATSKFNEMEQQIGNHLRLLVTKNQQDDETKDNTKR